MQRARAHRSAWRRRRRLPRAQRAQQARAAHARGPRLLRRRAAARRPLRIALLTRRRRVQAAPPVRRAAGAGRVRVLRAARTGAGALVRKAPATRLAAAPRASCAWTCASAKLPALAASGVTSVAGRRDQCLALRRAAAAATPRQPQRSARARSRQVSQIRTTQPGMSSSPPGLWATPARGPGAAPPRPHESAQLGLVQHARQLLRLVAPRRAQPAAAGAGAAGACRRGALKRVHARVQRQLVARAEHVAAQRSDRHARAVGRQEQRRLPPAARGRPARRRQRA